MPFQLDEEVAAGIVRLVGEDPPPPIPAHVMTGRRENTQTYFKTLSSILPPVQDVSTTDFHVTAANGHILLCRWFTKGPNPTAHTSTTGGGPAILYIHGGGMITGDLNAYNEVIKRYVSRTGVPFLFPEYRLAPECKAPIPVTDCHAALTHLVAHASEWGVDPRRIGLMGDSAGGGIAASLAHYIKLKGGPAVCKQILLYPMLDDTNLVPDPLLVPYTPWSYDDNATGWRALLGQDHETNPDISPIYAAGRMEVADARGLPDTYIDVGELDIFRDECLEYARKLGKAGVSCELHVVPGAVHISELLAPDSKVAKKILAWRDEVIASI